MCAGTNRIITPLIVAFVLLKSIPEQQNQKVMRKAKSEVLTVGADCGPGTMIEIN